MSPVLATTSIAALGVFGMLVFRSNSSRGGVQGLALIVASSYTILGLIPRAKPVYGVNPGEQVVIVIIVGFFVVAAAMFLLSGTAPIVGKPPAPRMLTPDSQSIAIAVGAVICCCAVLNYATGVIPALAPDINQARLAATDYGTLGRFWPILLPALQMNVVLAWYHRHSVRRSPWLLLGLSSLSLLGLQASRFLLLFPILVLVMGYFHVRRPSSWAVLLRAIALVALLGLIGSVRSSSTTGAELSPIESLDQSLQTGPRVFQLAVEISGFHPLQSSILGGDLLNFFHSSYERSDRAVTILIGRDPSVVGGSPPTLFGGAYLEFGLLGVLIAAITVAVVTSAAAGSYFRNSNVPRLVWVSWASSYFILSSYGLLSLRLSWLVPLVFCALLWRKEEAAHAQQRGSVDAHSDGVQVSNISGRR